MPIFWCSITSSICSINRPLCSEKIRITVLIKTVYTTEYMIYPHIIPGPLEQENRIF